MLPPLVAVLAADVKGFEAGLSRAKGELTKTVDGSNAGFNKLAGVGKVALLGIAGTAIAVGATSLKMAGDFQSSMTQLVTGAGESKEAIGQVSSGILAMSGQVGVSAQELAGAMFTVDSAGFHAADSLTVLKAAAQGAKVGGADTATMANALTSVLNAYGLKAKDASSITSEMVETVASGKMHMQDLASSISNVLPIAAAAHINFAQIGGAMATMTSQGMSADQASQDLANTIRSMLNPSSEAVKEMEQLGLNSTDLSQNLGKRGLTGTLEVLTQAITSHMGPSGTVMMDAFKKSKSASEDAQVEFSKMPASLQKLAKGFQDGTVTASDWRKELKDLPEGQRELAQQFAATVKDSRGFNDMLKSGSPAAQTYAAAMAKLTGGATGLNTSLMLTGDHLGTFKGNVDAISGAAKKGSKDVQGWGETQKDFNQQMEEAKDGAGALAIQFGTALIPEVEGGVGAIKGLTGWFAQHTTTAKVLAGVIGGIVVVAIGAYILQLGIATAKTVAHTVTEVASATKTAAVWVASNAAKIGAFIATSAAAVLHAGIVAATWIAQTAVAVATTIAGWAGAAVATIASWAVMAASAIVSAAAVMIAWIIAFWPIVLAIAAVIAIGVLLITHWNQVKEVAQNVGKAVISFFGNAMTWIHNAAQTVVNWLRSNWPLLLGILTGPIGLAVAMIVTHWTQIKQAFQEGVTKVQDFLHGLFSFISNLAANVVHAAESIGSNIVNGIINGLKGAWGGLVGTIKGLASNLPGPIKNVLGIASPSRVFADQVGLPIVQGWAQGIQGNQHLVKRALDAVVGARPSASALSRLSAGGAEVSAANSSGSRPRKPDHSDITDRQDREYLIFQDMLAQLRALNGGGGRGGASAAAGAYG